MSCAEVITSAVTLPLSFCAVKTSPAKGEGIRGHKSRIENGKYKSATQPKLNSSKLFGPKNKE